MKSNEFTTVIIEAEDNHYLTESDENIELRDRTIATRIALGKFDSADNWKEISQEEADTIKAEQEKLMKAEHDERDKK